MWPAPSNIGVQIVGKLIRKMKYGSMDGLVTGVHYVLKIRKAWEIVDWR